MGKTCSLKTAWRRRWAPVKTQVSKNYLKTAWRRRWAPVKAQVGQKLLPNCLPAAAAAQRSHMKHFSARPGPPVKNKKTRLPLTYLTNCRFFPRALRARIVFQKSRLSRAPFFGGSVSRFRRFKLWRTAAAVIECKVLPLKLGGRQAQ